MLHSANCDYFNSSRCRSCELLETPARLYPLPGQLLHVAQSVLPWELAPQPFGLRAKAKFSVTREKNRIVIGILDRNLAGVELLRCPQHRPLINSVALALNDLLANGRLSIYSISERRGSLKGIILQTNQAEDHIRVRFVVKDDSELSEIQKLAEQLIAFLPQLSTAGTIINSQDSYAENRPILSASVNIQPVPHQILVGEEEILITGPELLWENYGETKVAFPAQAFMQVTPEVATKLYSCAASYLAKVEPKTLVDLFCGAGGFALSLAKKANKVYGFEISAKAVEAARLSAQLNNISNAEFCTADLLAALPRLAEISPAVVICNPPRRGLGSLLIKALLEIKPQHLLYSSCNPESFLKDYTELESSYRLLEVTPFEMFPLTNHFELLGVLVLK